MYAVYVRETRDFIRVNHTILRFAHAIILPALQKRTCNARAVTGRELFMAGIDALALPEAQPTKKENA